ncbi:efflux transporter outer membrane subunit [Sphingomonas sp. H160509]|uniref:efflux transporter outer membrane subunit n=1 Tax=Sphingomonas sp. H160509 TaxID=2955313 RepID=UPI002097BD12|nr:efflux transporter outer membrane subunit [Sphingomonas sp. H160509]MDD1451400.1 efflux transporter outer membrane subunit [Sphingomonas sp. H160509]
MRRILFALPLLVTGCDLAPHYLRPAIDAPPTWPTGAAYAPTTNQPAGLPWRTVIGDARLRTLIEHALANNQNLAATVANVAEARAQYRVQRSSQLPTVSANPGATVDRSITNTTGDTQTFAANVGISSFEIDLFGRLKNLSKAAFQQYLATDAGMRSARILLIAETASAYLTFVSDRDLLGVAQETLKSGNRSLALTQSLHAAGLVAGTDVADAETVVAQAQSDVEQFTTQLAQDRNALALLVGTPVTDTQLPTSLGDLDGTVALVPAGLSSTVLLQRPDVVQAEHALESANANIGAARAAFFPTISLTGILGFASTALGALFTGGALGASGASAATLPILGGANRGNLDYAKAQRDYALAMYRYTIQTAFREVADELARLGTIDTQRAAQARLVAAASTSYRLADEQYRIGTSTFLAALIAQRTLYASQQTQIAITLADLQNRVALYQFIGADGGA